MCHSKGNKQNLKNILIVQHPCVFVHEIPTWHKAEIIALYFCFHRIGHQNGVLVLSCNGTVLLKKCKQLFEYPHLLLLRDIL